ncbi:rCG40763 [Rattus norvegicus]|uniref:RCG40763 n=1 Tax=Rattus norvegicus TaxID=10116 RepID=A6KNX7_RAT|nr:rCG40763 [Rattus norvegicus]
MFCRGAAELIRADLCPTLLPCHIYNSATLSSCPQVPEMSSSSGADHETQASTLARE